MAEGNNTSPIDVDDEYKKAIKPVVDDAMRTDALGAKFCVVLNEHKPTDEAIKKIVADAIRTDGNVKKAVEESVKEIDNKRKIRWIDRGISVAVGAIVTLAIGWAGTKIK